MAIVAALGIHLGPNTSLLKFLVTTWQARYDEIARVEAVGETFMTQGIRILTRDGEWAIFSSLQPPVGALRVIQASGTPVSFDPVALQVLGAWQLTNESAWATDVPRRDPPVMERGPSPSTRPTQKPYRDGFFGPARRRGSPLYVSRAPLGPVGVEPRQNAILS